MRAGQNRLGKVEESGKRVTEVGSKDSTCKVDASPLAVCGRDVASGVSRRLLLAGVGAAASLAVLPPGARAFSILKGAGDIRSLKMRCTVTGESINTIYWIEGEYIQEVLNEINYFMRDWRTNKSFGMKVRNLDILSATHQLLETSEPFNLTSGYRTRATNEMLRRRARNVSRNSLHITGEAADIRLEGRSVRKIASAATHCKGGGVGQYRRSNFVHLDCGRVRYWSA